MKKLKQVVATFAVAAAFLGIGSVLPGGALHTITSEVVSAATGFTIINNVVYQPNEDGGAIVVANTGASGDITIKENVTIDDKDYEVTTIKSDAFRTSQITNIEMPSVTTIGENAFNNCIKLTSVKMPKVTSISSNAFLECENLKSVEMPKVTSIASQAFSGCKALTSVDVSEKVEIGEEAFAKCISLESINLPNAVINKNAFSGCTSLVSAKLSNATIETDAFSDCTSLKLAYVPLGCDCNFEAGVARYVVSDEDDYIKISDIDTNNNTFKVVVNTKHFGGSVADGADYLDEVAVIVDGENEEHISEYVEGDGENEDYIVYYVEFGGDRASDHTVMAQVKAFKWNETTVDDEVPYYYVTTPETIEK